MPRKPKVLSGTLSKDDKIYIAEHLQKDAKWISGKLKKSVKSIQAYLDKLSPPQPEPNPVESEGKKTNKYYDQTGPAVIANETSASLPIKLSRRESPFKTR